MKIPDKTSLLCRKDFVYLPVQTLKHKTMNTKIKNDKALLEEIYTMLANLCFELNMPDGSDAGDILDRIPETHIYFIKESAGDYEYAFRYNDSKMYKKAIKLSKEEVLDIIVANMSLDQIINLFK